MFLRRLRPMLRVELIVLIVIAWMLALFNIPWWSAVGADRDWASLSTWVFLLATYVALVSLHFALLAPVMSRWTLRPLLTAIVVAGAAAAYYMRAYAVMLDPTMIQNVLKTDSGEALDLLTGSMVVSVVLWSALPVAFIWLVRIERHKWAKATLVRIGSVVTAVFVAIVAILPVNRDLTSMMRNHREYRYLVTPGNFIYGVIAQAATGARNVGISRELVGSDAKIRRIAMVEKKPRVFVLVVGETARAANFSLLGYSRATNPELSKLDIAAFRNVRSCGTSTEVSLPCMFSPYGRADYDERRIRNSEGLLDVLARAGYDVRWIDNQSGCKGVCRGESVSYRRACPQGECLDGVLVRELEKELAAVTRDSVVVLHMMGNHGPAYFKRYPREFRRFMPECATAELRQCTREQVVNSYDNAILYTDHVLASIVGTLKSHAREVDGAMLYLSDHGESLGEAGLYLHGLPYSIAPDNQKQVPMISWISPGFATENAVDRQCLRSKVNEPLSHDNLFHSVLGVLDVQTNAYRQERDLYEDCRIPHGTTFVRN